MFTIFLNNLSAYFETKFIFGAEIVRIRFQRVLIVVGSLDTKVESLLKSRLISIFILVHVEGTFWGNGLYTES